MRKIILLLIVLSVVLVGCGGEKALDEEKEGDERASETELPKEDTASVEMEEEQPPRTEKVVSFQPGDCPLTPKMVQTYCQIESPLSLYTEENDCAIIDKYMFEVLPFQVLSTQEAYPRYSVSSFSDFVDADTEAALTTLFPGEEKCPVKTFRVDGLGDEALITTPYEIDTGGLIPCTAERITNVESFEVTDEEHPWPVSFQLYVRKDNFIIKLNSGERYDVNNQDAGCSVQETKNLVRVLLGEETARPTVPGGRDETESAGESFTECPSNIVAWYPADGHARDVAGGFDGILSEGVSYTTGKKGQAFYMPSAQTEENSQIIFNTVYVPDTAINSKLKFKEGVTFATWVKLEQGSDLINIGGRILTISESNNLFFNSQGEGDINSRNTYRYIGSYTKPIPANKWVHVAVTADKNMQNLRLYADGKRYEKASYDSPKPPKIFFDDYLKIGYGLYEGAIDDVILFEGVLSEAQINQVMNGFIENSCEQISPSQQLTSCTELPSGIVAWWPAEGNANEIIGAGQSSLEDGMTFTNGVVGQAFFNSPPKEHGESILLPHVRTFFDPPIDLSGATTVLAWVKTDDAGDFITTLPLEELEELGRFDFSTVTDTIPQSPSSISLSHGNRVSFSKNTKNEGAGVSVLNGYLGYDIPSNEWVHIAATTDETNQNIHIYVNGVLTGYKYYETPQEAEDIVKNLDNLIFGYYLDGAIDEIMLFNRALSRAEIQNIVNAGEYGVCRP